MNIYENPIEICEVRVLYKHVLTFQDKSECTRFPFFLQTHTQNALQDLFQ